MLTAAGLAVLGVLISALAACSPLPQNSGPDGADHSRVPTSQERAPDTTQPSIPPSPLDAAREQITTIPEPIDSQARQIATTTVELDVYSGRPNPTWALTSTSATELDRRIARLTPMSRAIECPEPLGYRGFIVQSLDRASHALQTIRACDGVIKRIHATGTTYYADPQKQIEVWLLASAASAQPPLPAELITQIIEEIGAP